MSAMDVPDAPNIDDIDRLIMRFREQAHLIFTVDTL